MKLAAFTWKHPLPLASFEDFYFDLRMASPPQWRSKYNVDLAARPTKLKTVRGAGIDVPTFVLLVAGAIGTNLSGISELPVLHAFFHCLRAFLFYRYFLERERSFPNSRFCGSLIVMSTSSPSMHRMNTTARRDQSCTKPQSKCVPIRARQPKKTRAGMSSSFRTACCVLKTNQEIEICLAKANDHSQRSWRRCEAWRACLDFHSQ